jgi:HD-GYP domain-containing protein (c-di-GMP phosphodiesterase class II)
VERTVDTNLLSIEQLLDRVEQLTSIAIALSAQKNTASVLEKILIGVKNLTHADGGTLYLLSEGQKLRFEIMHNDSLGIKLGGTTGEAIPFEPIPLYTGDGRPNTHMVAAYTALRGETINIEDAYSARGFDFSGTRAFDEKTGYRSKSFLTIPMRNHVDELIGVLQVINALDAGTGEVTFFSEEHRRLAESLASLAAVALTSKRLIDEQRLLFESFVKLIATAIDEKSPHTSGHCRRVPELTMMIADAAARCQRGPLKEFHMSEEDCYELKIAAWMHDCGKVTTPEAIMEKATKLQTIFDRIELVDTRFELLYKDEMIWLLADKAGIDLGDLANPDTQAFMGQYAERVEALEAQRAFVRQCNIGGEFMQEEARKKVRGMGSQTWRRSDGKHVSLLTEDEVYNLTIPKGTLTPEERQVINNHIVVTIKMLGSLPWPKYLRNVPAYAGQHHERMDGRGFPLGLRGEEMSVQSRAMAIADIFEALTAEDRPYKKAKTLSESLAILGRMKQDAHIDPHLFDMFVRDKVYLTYAQAFLRPEQIDEVDHSRIPGFEEAC